MELKNFIDFAYSIVNMDEVKDGLFKIPEEIIYNLDEETHKKIHKEIKESKNQYDFENLGDDFVVNVFKINFNFKQPNKDG
jgi:hypothetical protein